MNASAGRLLAASLALLAAAAAGQNTADSTEGKLAYNGVGTGYTQVIITPSSGYGGAPLAMRLVLTYNSSQDADLDLYCNFPRVSGSPKWDSRRPPGIPEEIFIPAAQMATYPNEAVACTVFNYGGSGGRGEVVPWRLTWQELESPPHLSLSEQALMQQIFSTCCNSPDSCLELRSQTVNGQPSMDLCSACRECICNDKGNLVQIHWDDYRLSCPFPAAMLGAFPRLQFLRLRNNPGLTGEYQTFAEAFSNRSMIMFEIEGSPNITGQLASSATDGACLMAERGLGTLTVKQTGVSGPLPPCIFSPRMAQLYLDNNALNGSIPDAFDGARLLNLFQVDHNQLSGGVPPSLAAARVMQELYINANRLSGTLPDLFNRNEALVYLDVTNNSLLGPWPGSLANHSTANVIRAGLNSFASLPPQLTELPGGGGGSTAGVYASELPLRELDLSYNNLTGDFPAALAAVPNLERLNITGNHLSGPLPDEPDMFPRSQRLLIGTNNFSGPLPDSWNETNVISGRVRSTSDEQLVFNASWNQLTGPVPAWLAAAATHDIVDVSNNSFSNACTDPELVATPGICTPPPASGSGNGLQASAAVSAPVPGQASAALAWLALITIPVLALGGLVFWMHRRREQRRILRSLAAAQKEDGPMSQANSGSIESSGSGLVVAPWSDTMLPRSAITLTKGPNGQPLLLGQGGFGTVYRGTLFSEPVAVKVIKTGSALVNTEAILREVAILKACHSTYIVGFRGACVHEGELFLVTELMQGGDLWTALHSGRITWYNRGHQIALDVARGLAYLHEHRVIHMDLKSPNVLLTAQGVARIADIGLAGILSTTRSYIASSAVAVGTIAYCSPEQLLGLKCGFASDIYSFGVLLHEIATQATPVRGRMRPIRVPEEAPAEVAGLINLCMRSEAKERPTAPQVVSQLKLIRRRMLRAPDTARLLHEADSGSVAGTLGSASSGGGNGGKPGGGKQASGGSGGRGGGVDNCAAAPAVAAVGGELPQDDSLDISSKEGTLEQADSLALSKEASGSLPLSKSASSTVPLMKQDAAS